MDLARLTVRLEAQSSQLLSELDKANKKIDGFQRQAQQSLKKFSSGFKTAMAGIGIGIGIGIVVETIKAVVNATSEAEKALANLDNAVRNNGGAAGFSTQQLAGFSEELQKVTTYSYDAIQNMQALLLRFRGIGGSEFKQAQTAILDLATAMGVDLQTAAKTVGKALENPEKGLTALQKVGVRFTDSQKAVIKGLVDTGRSAEAQQLILAQLEQRFGGAAEAARNTFGGALEGLKNAASDLLENKGGLPGITAAINDLTKALQDDETKAAADSLTTGLFKGLTAVAKAAGFVLTPLAKLLTLANDVGAVLDKKVFGEQFTEDEFARLYGISARGTGPSRRGNTPLSAPTTQAGQSATAAIDTKPYDNAKKAIDQLILSQEQQIAVYKKGETETIKYRIAQGDLSDEFKALGADAGPLADKLTSLTQRYEALQKAAEQKAAVDAIKETVAALQQEVETYGLGETALLQYRLNHGDLAKQFETAGAAATQYRDDLLSLSTQLQVMDEATAGANAAIDEFSKKIEADLGGFADKLQTELEGTVTELNEFEKEAARNTQDILADTIAGGFEGGKDKIIASFADMLKQLSAQAIAANIAGYLFGEAGGGTKGSSGALAGAASFVAGLFTAGGTKDSGGRGSPGMAYAIGTGAQPETFVPDRPGTFYPAGAMGGMTINNKFIMTSSEPPSRRTQGQIAASAGRGIDSAKRRNT